MSPKSAFERYMESVDLRKFLEGLGTSNMDLIIKEIEHFTEREAEKRDRILLDYFGEHGINTITESVVERLLSPPELRMKASILDLGAGSGLFTTKVADEIRRHISGTSFYAMDITPAMLSLLARKTSKVTPFLGIAENIAGSVDYTRSYLEVPRRFDAIFSTLMLHHCSDVKKVFRSIREVLDKDGKVVVIDLCEHPFKEFREEMGDVHLGFDPSMIEKEAGRFFSNVSVEKIPGISCESSGRSAELFIAYFTGK